ncbi:MAG TPA: hypothetical protein PLA11_17185, partial [Flavobacteriales bacterium]|nr:hypothetical protein [Flavobacteriales bacterium]
MRKLLIIAILPVIACQREDPNPFADQEQSVSQPATEYLPEGNFAWLHQKVFHPTCAQSGCHDGTFEPDFRTISSSYNSLVYHPVIANDPGQTFTYRVLPGDVNASFLYERLTVVVPNTSGTMPLEVPPGSDWAQLRTYYIQKISQWIQNGAPDMFGNLPTPGNTEPQVVGLLAFPAGTTTQPYPRGTDPGVQPIEVPAAAVDVWFAFMDDATAPQDLQYDRFKISTSSNGFDDVAEQDLVVSAGFSGPDLGNSTTTFTHKAAIDLTADHADAFRS